MLRHRHCDPRKRLLAKFSSIEELLIMDRATEAEYHQFAGKEKI